MERKKKPATRNTKPRWDFKYDEENYGPDGSLTLLGVLTDGLHFLFFATWKEHESDPVETCHIYNSITMDPSTEECSYPWSARNDEILTACLNSLKDPADYCGDGSPIQSLEFLDYDPETD